MSGGYKQWRVKDIKSHRTKAYSELEIEIIKEYLSKGKGYDEIQERLNSIGYKRSRDSIATFIKHNREKYGLPNCARQCVFSEEEDDIIRRMLNDGYSCNDISEALTNNGHTTTRKQVWNHIDWKRRTNPDAYVIKHKRNHLSLKESFINKACEWLTDYLDHPTNEQKDRDMIKEMVDDFRKAMES